MNSSLKFVYNNSTESDLRIIVEPWGDQFLIQPDQQVEILIKSENTIDAIEFEQIPKGLIVFGEKGIHIAVFLNGTELAPSDQG